MNTKGLRISGGDVVHDSGAGLSAQGPERSSRARLSRGEVAGYGSRARDLAPLAGPDTVVVSLQNGMNPPVIAKRLGKERVVGAFVEFPADWQGPGHIEKGGLGHIWIGELDGRITERLSHIEKLLSHSVTRAYHGQHHGLPLVEADRLLAASSRRRSATRPSPTRSATRAISRSSRRSSARASAWRSRRA